MDRFLVCSHKRCSPRKLSLNNVMEISQHSPLIKGLFVSQFSQWGLIDGDCCQISIVVAVEELKYLRSMSPSNKYPKPSPMVHEMEMCFYYSTVVQSMPVPWWQLSANIPIIIHEEETKQKMCVKPKPKWPFSFLKHCAHLLSSHTSSFPIPPSGFGF